MTVPNENRIRRYLDDSPNAGYLAFAGSLGPVEAPDAEPRNFRA